MLAAMLVGGGCARATTETVTAAPSTAGSGLPAEPTRACRGVGGEELESLGAEVAASPYLAGANRLPLTSWDRFGSRGPKIVRVTGVSRADGQPLRILPGGGNESAGRAATWSGVLLATEPALAGGPVPVPLDAGAQGTEPSEATAALAQRLTALVGACALVVDGERDAAPLAGAPRLVAAAPDLQSTPQLFDEQFAPLVDRSVPLERQIG